MSDLLPPSPEGARPPAPVPPATTVIGSKTITCEFCTCTLAPDGSYVEMSPKARELRDQGEQLRDVRKQLAEANKATEDAQAALRAAQGQISQLQTQLQTKAKSLF